MGVEAGGDVGDCYAYFVGFLFLSSSLSLSLSLSVLIFFFSFFGAFLARATTFVGSRLAQLMILDRRSSTRRLWRGA